MLPLLREPMAPGASGDFQPPNERVSPQGSVEAQCGLVLNGQGGVIRRGKAPVCLSSVLVPEAVNTHNSPRHDKTASCRQTNRRNTPLLSSVSTLEQGRTHCRACFNALFLLNRTVTHTLVAPRIFGLLFILLEEIKMSQSLDQNDTDETHRDPPTFSVTTKYLLWKAECRRHLCTCLPFIFK